jgi:hypothetical protein
LHAPSWTARSKPRTRGIAILVLGALLGSACGPSWADVEPADGRFSIRMPGEPTEQTRTLKTVAGEIAMRIYAVEDSRASYMVSFADYPVDIVAASTPETVLDGARDGAAVNISGKVLHERAFVFQGHPARDVVVLDAMEVELRMRIVLVGRRLYQVAFTTERGSPVDAVGVTFRDSFRLLEAADDTAAP